jgi:DNA invertase Pin-like site-specific DNA recombinase
VKVAIYTRASADGCSTELSIQTERLFTHAEGVGWTVGAQYLDIVPSSASELPELKKALAATQKGEFDVLLFWSSDRFSRKGSLRALFFCEPPIHTVVHGSLEEQCSDTISRTSEVIVEVLANIAEFEDTRISAKIRSGLAVAKSNGKALGRPRSVFDWTELAEMRAKGMSLRAIANKTGKSAMTIQRILKASQAT